MYLCQPARLQSTALWATRLQFAALGVTAGAWGAHIPSIQQHHGLSEAGLATVLAAAGAGAVVALLFAGRAVARLGTGRASRLGAALMCVAVATLLWWPGLPWLLAPALVLGIGMSLFDVAINSAGAELERRGGRAVMGGLHGMFSVGAMAGAGAVAAMLAAGLAARHQLALLGACVAAAVAVLPQQMPVVPPARLDGVPSAHFAWPRGKLLLIGLLVLAGMLAEGVMVDWCVLYLKQELAVPQAQAALGYAAFAAAMALARFGADALRERIPEAALLRGGALLAALAMASVLLLGNRWVAMPGFVLVGAGLALAAPILFSAATRVPGVSAAAGIAAVTSVGYAGFMLGPPLIGGLAQASSLTVALWVVVLAAVALAGGASRLPLSTVTRPAARRD